MIRKVLRTTTILSLCSVSLLQPFSSAVAREQNGADNNEQCGMYLAKSTIPNAGMGLFAGKNFRKSSVVGGTTVGVLVTDLNFHNGYEPRWLHWNYFWNVDGPLQQYDAFVAENMVFELGSLINYHPWHVNVKPRDSQFKDSMFNRVADPGTGAVSYYDVEFYANQNIAPGQEIFGDYGENWVRTRQQEGSLGTFPLHYDYELAQKIALKTKALLEGIDTNSEKIVSTIQGIVNTLNDAIGSIFPATSLDLDRVVADGITSLQLEQRSLKWLENNGLCMDNIIARQSTLDEAGRGIFATREIKKGELIVPLPILHILDRSEMNMYGWERDANAQRVRTGEYIGQQLYLNYCFGDNASSVLLCPVSNGIIVNHKSARAAKAPNTYSKEGCTDGPNGEVQWADWDDSNNVWLNLTMEELNQKEGRGMSMEIIASRDIKVGEEIFIDYGVEWEEAWNRHLVEWRPDTEDFGRYKSLHYMNTRAPVLKLKEELDNAPYPDNIFTLCLYWELDEYIDFAHDVVGDDQFQENEWNDKDLMETFSIPGHHFRVGAYSSFDETWWPCEVYRRDSKGSYTVRILQDVAEDATSWTKRRIPRFVRKLSRQAIHFSHKRGTSDQFLPGAFRHHIGLPDGMFPVAWKTVEEHNM